MQYLSNSRRELSNSRSHNYMGVDTRYTRKEITKIDILKNSLTMKSFQVKECVTGMRQNTGGVRRRQDI